jgi:hypothetical protein
MVLLAGEAMKPPLICQVVYPQIVDHLPCEARESGGYRCENLEPHGDEGHRVRNHTIRHSQLGNGYTCGAVGLE